MRISNCKNCNRSFKFRSNKIFCCEKCKYEYWAYKRSLDKTSCYYCGLPADTIDHIPPQSIRAFISEDPVLSLKYPFTEVNACRECNSLLGARAFWTPESRKEFIKKALAKRYKKFLKVKCWSGRDLNEFDYGLKTYILNAQIQAEILRKRLNF